MSWNEADWELNGEVEWLVMNITNLCQSNTRSVVVFNDRLTLSDSRKLCKVG